MSLCGTEEPEYGGPIVVAEALPQLLRHPALSEVGLDGTVDLLGGLIGRGRPADHIGQVFGQNVVAQSVGGQHQPGARLYLSLKPAEIC